MGRVLVSLPPATNADDSKQAYFQALKDQLPTAPTNDVYIGDFVESGSVSTQDFVSVAVSGRQPFGFVVVTADVAKSADVDVPSVYKSLNAVNTPVGTINFYLLNPTGTVLSPSLHVSAVKLEDQQIIKRLQSGGSQAAFQYTSPITGSLSVGAAVPVGGTGLTLIGEIPSQPLGAAQGAQGFLLALLAVVVVCVLVLTLTAVLLNARLVRPLLHLVPLANQAARGQVLDDPDALNQRDEIGQLYIDFKTIATRMKQEHQDLEARVMQRTDSLER